MSTSEQALMSTRQRTISMVILFLMMVFASADRFVFSLLIVPVKAEFGLSDTMMGLLTGPAFAILYATLGIPVARIADVGNRRAVISIALALWSSMTVLCGMATTLVQLFIFRIGVGIGEAGAVPPSHSLISMYYPPERRSVAFAIVNVGSAAGSILVMVIGGWIVVHYGWRMVLIVFGLPGILVAVLAHFMLYETRTGFPMPKLLKVFSESFEAARRLFAIPAFRHLAVVYTIYGFVAYGGFMWDITFFYRSFEIPFQKLTPILGVSAVVSSLVGLMSGGYLGNYLGGKSLSWLARIPMYAMFCCFPLFLMKYLVFDFYLSVVLTTLGAIILMMFVAPFYAAVQAIVPEGDRGMATAIMVFLGNIIGMGIGPFATGFLSDTLVPLAGVESLRYTLVLLVFLLPLAGLHGLLATRHMRKQNVI